MELGPPSTFFVRRPDATDVSESLGRYPTDGLVARFTLDTRCWPKGCNGRLRIISGSASDTSGDDGIEDGALEALWQTILGDLGSNRCLILAAGRDLSLTASSVFAMSRTSGNTAGEEASRSIGDEQLNIDEGQLGHGSGISKPQKDQIDQAATELLQAGQSRPVTVCIDFRLDLDLDALARDREKSKSNSCSGREEHSSEKNVRIIACGEHLEIWVTLRLSPPPPPQAASADADTTETPSPEKEQAIDAPPSSQLSMVNANCVPCSTWNLHSISARAGSRTITLPCIQSGGERNQQCRTFGAGNEEMLGVEEEDKKEEKGENDDENGRGGERAHQAGGEVVYDSAAWHSVALAVDPKCDESVLCLDGDIFTFHTNDDATSAAGSSPCHTSGLFVSDEDIVVVIGGAGGMWGTLAVKNLAVYSVGLDQQHIGALTRVFRRWKDREETAAAKEEKEDEYWLEESRQAKEEEREAGETEHE